MLVHANVKVKQSLYRMRLPDYKTIGTRRW